MADNADYLELKQTVLGALHDLLSVTEPGTGLFLHTAYATLKKDVEQQAEEKTREVERAAALANVRRPQWDATFSFAEREREVLDLLAEHRLIIHEVAERLQAKHGPDVWVHEGSVRNAVNSLYKDRELDREPETFRKTRTRYRYFKRLDLDGPIAELDRAFRGGDA